MNLQEMRNLSSQIDAVMPWIHGIRSDKQYDDLMALMDQLVEDYDANRTLIDLLFPVLEQYEETAERFKSFNDHVAGIDQGVAMVKLIIDQNSLTLSDLPEIGGKSLVSQILNGKRALTLKHIRALSERFGIPAHMFV